MLLQVELVCMVYVVFLSCLMCPSVYVFVFLLGGSQSVLSLEFCIGVLGGKHEQARYLVGFQG